MPNQIVQRAESYVTGLLKKGLTKDHVYHDLKHTLSVRDSSLQLGKKYRLNEEELELLELSALFHDTGFSQTYDNHEDVSKEIAADFLRKENYPEDKLSQIIELIEITKVTVEPVTLLQKILKDADFNTNGATYQEKSDALRHEWRVFCGNTMNDDEWLRNNIEFWNSHQFYTGEALALYGEEKRKTLKKLNKKMEKAKEGEEETEFSIAINKNAQMMFKTTLRNQIDLTNIADNKANIMLSINSLLITFGMPLLVTQLEKFPSLIWPGTTLLATCVLTIVYATLATRPVKMEGFTDLSKISQGNTNLFFFGNFFKMTREDYIRGLRQVTMNEDILDKTIVNDLYFLGRALGQKYHRLRVTYSIFMIGMVLTVGVFAATFLF
jgi:predicted metal-dependent HD superfamily phosphohydrolase